MKKKVWKWLLGILIFLLVAISIMVVVVKNKEYQPSQTAISTSQEASIVDNVIRFEGDNNGSLSNGVDKSQLKIK